MPYLVLNDSVWSSAFPNVSIVANKLKMLFGGNIVGLLVVVELRIVFD